MIFVTNIDPHCVPNYLFLFKPSIIYFFLIKRAPNYLFFIKII